MELLRGERGLEPAPTPVLVRELPGRGRGLVAAWDLAADEPILSLPLGSCVVGPPQRDVPDAEHWGVPMALCLLDTLRTDVGLRVSWLPYLPIGPPVPLVLGTDGPGTWSGEVAAESRRLRESIAAALGGTP